MAVLANKPSITAFVISNSLAIVLSALAIFIHFVVLNHLPGLAIPVCILGSVFFFLSFYVIYKVVKWVYLR
ncbi:hypothetical protein MKX01_027525 [Papaver californicum]|nr:hypothetical protein MKX01_027525 [Papaver californicum]